MLQALLVTFGDYVYDHPESTQQGLAHILATGDTRQQHVKCKRASNRRQLTAMSWASLVAAVRTSNSCISTVGRKLTMTCVSVAWRHCGNLQVEANTGDVRQQQEGPGVKQNKTSGWQHWGTKSLEQGQWGYVDDWGFIHTALHSNQFWQSILSFCWQSDFSFSFCVGMHQHEHWYWVLVLIPGLSTRL